MVNIDINKILFVNKNFYSYLQIEKQSSNKVILSNNNVILSSLEQMPNLRVSGLYLQKTCPLKLKDEDLMNTYKNFYVLNKKFLTVSQLLTNISLIFNHAMPEKHKSFNLNSIFLCKKKNKIQIRVGGLVGILKPLYFYNILANTEKLKAKKLTFQTFNNIFFLLKTNLTINNLANIIFKFAIENKQKNKANKLNYFNSNNSFAGRLFILYSYKNYVKK